MLLASEGLQRLVLAELVRQRMDATGEAQRAAVLVKVTGWRECELERYPGTSSMWVEHSVLIFWVDDAEEPQTYEWRGTFAELTAAMQQLIDEY